LWKLLAEQDDCIKQPFYALEGGEIEKSVFFARKKPAKHAEKTFLPLAAALPRRGGWGVRF
jgi:hypothetical protein